VSAPICVARIGAAHGVRGAVKLWTFTEDPLAVKRYGPLMTKDGTRQFEVTQAREAKGHLVATLKGIATRDEAERLNGLELYVARDKLPATDQDEYYHADLIGLTAVTAADAPLGRVIAIHNFGAGDIIEIAPASGATMLLPFTNAVVPTVDLANKRVVIELPQEIEGDHPADADLSVNEQNPSSSRPPESGDPKRQDDVAGLARAPASYNTDIYGYVFRVAQNLSSGAYSRDHWLARDDRDSDEKYLQSLAPARPQRPAI
jgi:16S rRNA processing protein RimM